MQPNDDLFNWPTRKDPPGTKKMQLPRIIVTPPTSLTKSIFNRKKRSRKNCQFFSSPSKPLLLDPQFWSYSQTVERPRKQKVQFECRNSIECKDKFVSVKDRKVHEAHCFTFDEVFLCSNIGFRCNHNYILDV